MLLLILLELVVSRIESPAPKYLIVVVLLISRICLLSRLIADFKFGPVGEQRGTHTRGLELTWLCASV